MIAKHIAMTAARKSSFARLVRYLTDSHGKEVRVGAVRITNCMNDSAEVAALEVLNTQTANTRSAADKTYHLIISFRRDEHPDAAALAAIEDRLCEALGFSGHQRVSVVHDDTDNLHLHVAINKIHPTRYTIREPFNAYRILARLCETLENEFSLQKDNHTPRQVAAENRAADMERHAGVQSLLGWVKRECIEQMRSSQSWQQLHGVLAENGLCLHPRANGLVITADDGTTVKASSVGREFSKPKLEQRFGPFQAGPEHHVPRKPAWRYEKKPLATSVDTTELYARYRLVQGQAAESRKRGWEQARARKERRIEAAKRSVHLKRAALKLMPMPGAAKKLAYRALTRALHEEIAAIMRLYRRERQTVDQQHRRSQWTDWLRREAHMGDIRALAALRGRSSVCAPTGDAITGHGPPKQPVIPHSGHGGVTKKGTIIYRIGDSAIRDDGDRLKVSLGADQGAMQQALWMAKARYGDRIAVNGSDAFKEQILMAAVAGSLPVAFADAALEQRRMQLISASVPRGTGTLARPHVAGANCGQTPPPGEVPCSGIPAASGRDGVIGAADRYIAEREQKRINGFDIPKHARYTSLNAGPVWFAGTRRVDGQMLALLKHGDQVMVLEVNDATARRLRRLPLGAQVGVTAQGVIKTKGRRR